MSDPPREYGVIANVRQDPTLRRGAKVWLVDGWSGGGWERVFVRGLSRPGDTIQKWIPAANLHNIRPAWVPGHLREKVRLGDRPAAEQICAAIARWTSKERTFDHQS